MNQTDILELKNKMNDRKMKQRPSIIIKPSRKEYANLKTDLLILSIQRRKKNIKRVKVCINYGTLSTERKCIMEVSEG